MTNLERKILDYLKGNKEPASANDLLRSSEFYNADFLELYKALQHLSDMGEIDQTNDDGVIYYEVPTASLKKSPSDAGKHSDFKKKMLALELTDSFDTVDLIAQYDHKKTKSSPAKKNIFADLHFSNDQYSGSNYTFGVPDGFSVFEGSITDDSEVSCTRDFTNGATITLSVTAENEYKSAQKFRIFEEYQILAKYFTQCSTFQDVESSRQEHGIQDYSDGTLARYIGYIYHDEGSSGTWNVNVNVSTPGGCREFRFDYINVSQDDRDQVLSYTKKWVDTIRIKDKYKVLPGLDDSVLVNQDLDSEYLKNYLRFAEKTFKHVESGKLMAEKFTEAFLNDEGRGLSREDKRKCVRELLESCAACRVKYLTQLNKAVNKISYKNADNILLLDLYQYASKYYMDTEEKLTFDDRTYNDSMPLREVSELKKTLMTDEIRKLTSKDSVKKNKSSRQPSNVPSLKGAEKTQKPAVKKQFEGQRRKQLYNEAMELVSQLSTEDMNEAVETYDLAAAKMKAVGNLGDAPQKAQEFSRKAARLRQKMTEPETRSRKPAKKSGGGGGIKVLLAVLVLAGLLAGGYFYGLPIYKYKKAEALYLQQQYSEAAEMIKQLGSFKDSKDFYQKIKLEEASSLLSGSKFDDALKIYDALKSEGVSGINDLRITALKQKWDYYLYLEDYESAYNAAVELRQYTELDETFDQTAAWYIRNLLDADDVDKAKTVMAEMNTESSLYLELIPEVDVALFRKAQTAYDSGDYGAALGYLDSMGTVPESQTIYKECNYQLGVKAIEAGNPVDAIAYLEKASGFTDADNQLNFAKYMYVDQHLNTEDTLTKEYLEELAIKKYSDARTTYKDLYGVNAPTKKS